MAADMFSRQGGVIPLNARRTRNNDNADNADGASPDYSVRAVRRVCTILDLLQESVGSVPLSVLAAATGTPKSTVFRYMRTLEEFRFVERDAATASYRLGLGFVGMQSRLLEVLRERARPWLERLRDELDETANLGVLDGDQVIYVDLVESRRTVRHAASQGDHDPLHSTALGKAIASELDTEQVRDLLAGAGMARHTPNTITDIDTYLSELERVRRVGHAVEDGEHEVDGRCVAVPIRGVRLPAAISLSAPAARFTVHDVERAAEALHEVVDHLGE